MIRLKGKVGVKDDSLRPLIPAITWCFPKALIIKDLGLKHTKSISAC